MGLAVWLFSIQLKPPNWLIGLLLWDKRSADIGNDSSCDPKKKDRLGWAWWKKLEWSPRLCWWFLGKTRTPHRLLELTTHLLNRVETWRQSFCCSFQFFSPRIPVHRHQDPEAFGRNPQKKKTNFGIWPSAVPGGPVTLLFAASKLERVLMWLNQTEGLFLGGNFLRMPSSRFWNRQLWPVGGLAFWAKPARGADASWLSEGTVGYVPRMR